MSLSLSHGKPLDVGHVGISAEDLPPVDQGPIDLRGWFATESRNHPLDLEIGSGKGTFLVQQASLSPNVNYLGIEYAKAFWCYAADRCRRRGLENVRLVRAEAAFFIRHYVPECSFSQVHIYFPDPWPKKRHHKRRLIQIAFLQQLHHTLVDGALIRIASDHADYWKSIREHVAQVSHLFELLPFESPASAGDRELAGTNFERKYRRDGRPFYGLLLRKR